MPINRFKSEDNTASAVLAGSHIYISCQIPAGKSDENVATQMHKLLGGMDRCLRYYGAGRDDLAAVTVWLKDIAEHKSVNEIWLSWLSHDHAPVQTFVQSELPASGGRVEIAAVAYIEVASPFSRPVGA